MSNYNINIGRTICVSKSGQMSNNINRWCDICVSKSGQMSNHNINRGCAICVLKSGQMSNNNNPLSSCDINRFWENTFRPLYYPNNVNNVYW